MAGQRARLADELQHDKLDDVTHAAELVQDTEQVRHRTLLRRHNRHVIALPTLGAVECFHVTAEARGQACSDSIVPTTVAAVH